MMIKTNCCRLLVLLSVSLALPAQAIVYKCTDSDGHVTYTNDRSMARKCDKLPDDLPFSSVPAPSFNIPSTAKRSDRSSSSKFPRVDAAEQTRRDKTRQEILRSELRKEREALEKARNELGTEQPQTLTNNTTSVEAAAAAFRAHQQQHSASASPVQTRVEQHQRNINALQKEIKKFD